MGRGLFCALVVTGILFPLRSAIPCTTVAMPKSSDKIVAKSYDWHRDHGMVIVNLRGIEKNAFVHTPGEVGAEWKSKYGSLTFNQYGREFPLGGVNEKGLVVEIMWFDGTEYPKKDTRPMVNELQWIQYQLDNFSTVAEVEKAVDAVRVVSVYANTHYMACDAGGACATFEYVKGKMAVTSGASLKVPTLTNDSYSDSVAFLDQHAGFGGTRAVPAGQASLARFVRASSLAAKYDPKGSIAATDAAFDVLDSVGGTSETAFHIVYEPKSLKVHFRTQRFHKIKDVDLSKFDLDCDPKADKTVVLDMNQDLEGDVNGDFVAYTESENRRMIDEGMGDIAGHLPPGAADAVSKSPSQQQCR